MADKFVEGPFGFPMLERTAVAVEQIQRALPKDEDFAFRRSVTHKAGGDVMPGERSDISWISTESPDRQKEIVIAKGMNESQFKLNPIVTFEHNYKEPPVGRSSWRKITRDGQMAGIKAKTLYPARPENLGPAERWPPDFAFGLVDAGLLRGKSVGILPTKVSPGGKDVRLVIHEWILLEYACTFMPVQQQAVVEAISKCKGFLPVEWTDRVLAAYPNAAAALSKERSPDQARASARARARFALIEGRKVRFPINDPSDLQKAWMFRRHSTLPTSVVEAFIRQAGGILKSDGPWNCVTTKPGPIHGYCENFEYNPADLVELHPVSRLMTLAAIEKAISRRIQEFDFESLTAIAVENALARKMGRV